MAELVQHLPAIIEQAASSPLGIFALMIITLSVLGFFFFRTSSERTRVAMFIVMFIGVVTFGIATFRTTPSAAVDKGASLTSVDVSGQWEAEVKYSWGLKRAEKFKFSLSGGRLTGTASFLGSPRPISSGKIDGDRISFSIMLEDVLGSAIRQYENRYTGDVSEEGIRFQLLNNKGDPPMEFLAKRVPD